MDMQAITNKKSGWKNIFRATVYTCRRYIVCMDIENLLQFFTIIYLDQDWMRNLQDLTLNFIYAFLNPLSSTFVASEAIC